MSETEIVLGIILVIVLIILFIIDIKIEFLKRDKKAIENHIKALNDKISNMENKLKNK